MHARHTGMFEPTVSEQREMHWLAQCIQVWLCWRLDGISMSTRHWRMPGTTLQKWRILLVRRTTFSLPFECLNPKGLPQVTCFSLVRFLLFGRNFMNGFQCECAAGYEGPTCELDINECASNPCLRQGVCRDLPNAFECRCIQGFTGDLTFDWCHFPVSLAVCVIVVSTSDKVDGPELDTFMQVSQISTTESVCSWHM